MARPLRLDLAGGWYHVANRGAGRQRVFRNDEHRQIFLDLLADLTRNFGIEVHVYCLMTNRYDLVLHTPRANLSTAMRHLGGVYTQRYNRMTGRDGPLFRGRFKSIIFEPGSFLPAVSRHIHRRPLVTGTVARLDRYRWSSYPSYVTRRKNPDWLCKEAMAQTIPGGPRDYRQYTEREGETNAQARAFYRHSRPGVILGDEAFHEKIKSLLQGREEKAPRYQWGASTCPRDQVLKRVAEHYQVRQKDLLTGTRGRLNEPRLAAVWLCRHRCGLSLADIADLFGMSGFGSASGVLHRIKGRMPAEFWRRVQLIDDGLI